VAGRWRRCTRASLAKRRGLGGGWGGIGIFNEPETERLFVLSSLALGRYVSGVFKTGGVLNSARSIEFASHYVRRARRNDAK